MRLLRSAVIVAGLLAGLASAGLAQTPYGSIQGRVLDQNRKPLGEATVLLFGTSQLGSRICVTKANGNFHFPALTGGTYTVRAELPGHRTLIWRRVIVIPGQTVEWNPVLVATAEGETAPEEEEEVGRSSPIVDVRSPALRTHFDSLLLATLPTNRDLYDFQNSIPGAITEDREFLRTSSILGGTVRSQVYAVDGSFFNDPVDFTVMTDLGVDVMNDIVFEEAGHPAESGRAGGTTLNIITKTGGSRTTASLTAYLGGDNLNKVTASAADVAQAGRPPLDKYSSYGDYSFSLGGPVLEDVVWATINIRRLAWDRVNPFTPEARTEAMGLFTPHYDLNNGVWAGFFRMTLQYGKSLRYSGLFDYTNTYQPVDIALVTPKSSQPYTSVLNSEYSIFTTHDLEYTLNPTTAVDVRASYAYRSIPVMTRDTNAYTSYDFTHDVWFGSAPFNDQQNRRRILGTASITKYADGLLGADHELKAAFEFEESQGVQDWNKTNPFITYWYDFAAGNPYYVSPAGKEGRLTVSPLPSTSGLWAPTNSIRRFAGYVQDSLRSGRLALNLGATIDYSYLYESGLDRSQISPSVGPELLASGVTSSAFLLALSKEVQKDGLLFPLSALSSSTRKLSDFLTVSPRFGLVLDPFGDSRTALKASVARYYEPYWIGLYDYDNIFGPTTLDYIWKDLNGNGKMDLPSVDQYQLIHYPNQDPARSIYAGGLKAPYTDELLVGLEHEFLPDFKVGLNFIYRVDKNILDTFDVNNGYDPTATDSKGPIWLPFTFTDPGLDGKFGTPDDQTLTVYGLRRDRPMPDYVIGNISGAKREYKAAMLSFEKRLSHGWELQGSFIYSSYKGNIGAGTTDTDLENRAFNNPNTLVNGYGPLFFDRPLQFRLLGTWVLPWNIIASANFQAYSGIPWNRTLRRVYFPDGFGAEFGGVQTRYVMVNAEAPGTHRYQAYVNLDFHLEKGFSIGGAGKLTLIADVFNLLGNNGVTLVTDPAGVLRYDLDPVVYEPSPNYGQVATIFGIRALRLGLRIGV